MTGLSYSCAHMRKTIYKAPSRKERKGPPTKSKAKAMEKKEAANRPAAKSKAKAKTQTQDNGIYHGVVVVSDCLI